MNRKTLIYIIGIATLLLSCSEDFLNKKPIAMDTEETFYTTPTSIDQTLTAAYSVLVAREIFDIRYIVALSSAEDDIETGGENVLDWPEFQRIDRYINTPEDPQPYTDLWGYMYKGIRFCNAVFYYYDKLVKEDPSINTPDMQHKLAEAKFLRALYHFYLVKIFGGVPIVDHVLYPLEAKNIKRNKLSEVYHFIEKDLLEAVPVLKERDNLPNGEIGRASKGAARALLAKVYLFESSYWKNYSGDSRFEGCENHYSDALKYAEDVINSGKYELVGINGERWNSWWNSLQNGGIGGFRYIFTVDGDNSKESVFECQNVQDGKGWSLTRGSYLTIYTTIRYAIDKNGAEQQLGWSFLLPTSYLVSSFGNKDNREILIWNF